MKVGEKNGERDGGKRGGVGGIEKVRVGTNKASSTKFVGKSVDLILNRKILVISKCKQMTLQLTRQT